MDSAADLMLPAAAVVVEHIVVVGIYVVVASWLTFGELSEIQDPSLIHPPPSSAYISVVC